MARPISWLARTHEIRRAVAGSVRSHYERKEIEALFQIQPRTAQLLLEMLPATVIGRSRLVERQALSDFIERIHKAENPSAELDLIRAQGSKVSRKKVRSLVRRDIEPISLASLPSSISLSRGRLEVSFRTVEGLAQTMYALARVIESDGDEMARQFEVHEDVEDAGAPMRDEFDAMMAELAELEAARTTPRRNPEAS